MTASGATRGGRSLLTVNAGSSSLNAGVYDLDRAETHLLSAQVERPEDLPDHQAALQALLAELRSQWPDDGLAAVGHRVVHGGAVYAQPYPITTELLAALRHVVPLAPNHLPSALAAIQAIAHAYPGVPQVASFDTAFHRTMPRLAQLDALPRALAEAGIIRYGFPSLSYESILWRLRAVAGAAAADGRVIIAHRSAPICNRTRT